MVGVVGMGVISKALMEKLGKKTVKDIGINKRPQGLDENGFKTSPNRYGKKTKTYRLKSDGGFRLTIKPL